MEQKRLRNNFIEFLKEKYNYARPDIMASNVFYVWHHNIGMDFWDIFETEESMQTAKMLLLKRFEESGRKNPKGHADVHYGCWKKFKEFIEQQDSIEPSTDRAFESCDDMRDFCETSLTFDLPGVIDNLRLKRKLFHSEADFQFALAWEIQTQYPEASVRLEYCPKEIPEMHIDVIVELDGNVYPIELKYKTLKFEALIDEEVYALKSHGAQDIGKYDCLIDIQRLEQCSQVLNRFKYGYVIWLTNDPSYWSTPKRKGTVAEEFTIHDGVCKCGDMAWASHTGAGTQKGREAPVSLKNEYLIHWKDYGRISDGRAGKLRYVLMRVERPD